VYLNDRYLSTASFRQTVVEGDPKIIAMSYAVKILEGIRRSSPYLGEALLRELGNLWELAATLIVISVLLIALAGTGIGLALEILVLAVGVALASKQLLEGIGKLVEFLEVTRAASSEEDLDIAGEIFAQALVKIGLGSFFLLLSYFGVARVRTQVQARIAKGSVNLFSSIQARLSFNGK